MGLAGSPWPTAAPEGGLREAQQEGRASWQQTGLGLGRRPPRLRVGLRCSPGTPPVHPRGQDDACRVAPAARPTGHSVSSPPALSRAPSLGTFQRGLGEGRSRLWALPGEGAGLPGLLPWGRLENKQAGSQTSDCVENPVGAAREPSALGGGGAWGEGPGGGVLPRGHWEGTYGAIFDVLLPIFPRAPPRLGLPGRTWEAGPRFLGGIGAPTRGKGLGLCPAPLPPTSKPQWDGRAGGAWPDTGCLGLRARGLSQGCWEACQGPCGSLTQPPLQRPGVCGWRERSMLWGLPSGSASVSPTSFAPWPLSS